MSTVRYLPADPAGRCFRESLGLLTLTGPPRPSACSDEELLARLLSPRGGRAGDALARQLLEAGWPRLPPGWAEPTGLSPAQWVRLDALAEFASRLAARDGSYRPLLSTPGDVRDVVADLETARREHFVGLYLNARNRLLARETISVGSLNASIVHPREVFEPALRLGAASLVVVHNHPSGETDPSDDDLHITRRLVEAGEILGIALLDHVIVGTRGYTSLKEKGGLPGAAGGLR